MKRQHDDAQVVPYPKYWRFAAEANRSVRHKPMIHGLLEADVTRPRAALRAHQAQTGESLSFTAFLATCLAKAVAEHKAVQAFRQGSKQLVLFEDVDVNTRIEREVAGQKFVVPYIIRAAQAANANDLLTRFRLFSLLPTAFFRPVVWGFTWLGRRQPRVWKRTMGTVGITAVGMFGNGAGWGIPASSPTTLMVTVGGIGQKQVLVDGHVAVREYLDLTISVDHDLVDGAPAARFTKRLKELIESGYGLGDIMAASASQPAAAEGASTQEVYR